MSRKHEVENPSAGGTIYCPGIAVIDPKAGDWEREDGDPRCAYACG
jgi:hypothetical protein